MITEGRLFLDAPLFAGNLGMVWDSLYAYMYVTRDGKGLGRGTGVVGGHIIPGHRTGLGRGTGVVGGHIKPGHGTGLGRGAGV